MISRFVIPSLIVLQINLASDLQAKPVDFAHDVVPILKQHCVACHGGREAKGSFSLNTRQLWLESGFVDLKDAGDSYLLELVTSDDPEMQMPPKGKPRLSSKEVATLKQWVAEDLPWEAGFTFGKQAYEPPLKPRRPELPPAVDNRTHPIDRLIDHYLAEHQLPRPGPIDDATFLRRIHLDLVGLLPTPEELNAFLDDTSPDKRTRKIRELLDDDTAYADHWLSFFNDLLRNDYSGTGFITGGRKQVSGWLYESLLYNKPFDQLTRELIAPPTDASRGFIDGIKWRGNVSAGQTVEIQFAQSLGQAFLGINLKCASCHDSFIDRWTLEESYGLAAIYSERELEIHRCDKPIGKKAKANWLFPKIGTIDPSAPREARLQQLAQLMTDPQNGRFTRTIVNRLWHRMLGRGIVYPLDAMQTKPWNEELLDYLAVYLSDQKYDLKKVLELIATSEAYQSQVEIVEGSEDSDYLYRGPRSRRLTAEQFLDSVWQITGSAPAKFDAPIFRTRIEPGTASEFDLKGKWIWGDSAKKVPPANETIVVRKIIDLPAAVKRGGAVLTCDNSHILFINRREVDRGDNWAQVRTLPLHTLLKRGKNEITAIVHNGGGTPNPAGFFFDARLELENGEQLAISSDETWEWNPKAPATKEGRLGGISGKWNPVTIVKPVGSWTNAVDAQAKSLLAVAAEGKQPMVRASLLKNTALMKSLGRPMREQIVSMRPSQLTTLEAIDLSNEASLAQAFSDGAKRLIEKSDGDPKRLTKYLYEFALSREPTAAESEIITQILGEKPQPAQVEDLLWSVCMLPEFFLIR
ncbi:Planctomycete cytochrome C [Gimesia panareensis]|uniref:Planctomycete cytochrome C n=1 Tax=Gimesia panareensis TaxID=2527978 RepID=A0A518FLI4_9PLAN|nr:DUF1549 domain-containing protein [Gimesia panareensis]QDV17214.1 Planctomycete cytochrome C [Gimesia panareensis]